MPSNYMLSIMPPEGETTVARFGESLSRTFFNKENLKYSNYNI